MFSTNLILFVNIIYLLPMKKKFELWFAVLSPAALFVFACYLFNLVKYRIDVITITIVAASFIAVQLALYKLFNKKIPDVAMRSHIPLTLLTVLISCYLSGNLNPTEVKIAAIFAGFAISFILLFVR